MPDGKVRRLRVMFVCGRNQWRSPTAEAMYRNDPRLEVRSAGVSPKARRRFSGSDLDWADVIFVMERDHKRRIADAFPGHEKLACIHCLDIPDDFQFMQPDLTEWLDASVEPLIEAALASIGDNASHDL